MTGRTTRMGAIDLYIQELRASLGSRPDTADILAEAEDHLREAADRLCSAGLDPETAQRTALERYGAIAQVSREFSAAGKGVAMPSTLTRLAGLAALALPVAVGGGAAINEAIPRGAVHGLGVVMLFAAFPLGILFFVGLWRRHGGALGKAGKAGVALAVASPLLSVPFAWGAGVALVAFLALATTLTALAVARAGMLPALPAVLIAIGPAFMIATGAIGAAAGFDGTFFWVFGFIPTVVGLLWLGTVLARETPGGLVAA